MITTPTQTTVLDPKSQQAIDMASNQLATIQADITSSQKALVSIKADSVNAVRDREYQQGLLDDLTAQVADTQAKVHSLHEEMDSLILDTASLRETFVNENADMEVKKNALNDREATISSKESELSARELVVANKEVFQADLQAKLDERYAKITVFKETL